jgi:hypothetical protein
MFDPNSAANYRFMGNFNTQHPLDEKTIENKIGHKEQPNDATSQSEGMAPEGKPETNAYETTL